MFEMIGLIIATAIFFVLSLCAGLVYAGIAFLILRKYPRRRIRLLILATAVPVCSAAYMWLCVAILPGKTLFGDIFQPLPNGYELFALGKMPDAGVIRKEGAAFGGLGSIGSLMVDGPLIVAQKNDNVASFYSSQDPTQPFLIFDTATGKSTYYPDRQSLERHLGHTVTLTESQFFRSKEARYLRRHRIDNAVMFIPPITLTIFYFLFVIRLRRSESQSQIGNLY